MKRILVFAWCWGYWVQISVLQEIWEILRY